MADKLLNWPYSASLWRPSWRPDYTSSPHVPGSSTDSDIRHFILKVDCHNYVYYYFIIIIIHFISD